MAIFLSALGIQNYRGIGETEQRMSGFQSLNFFIGPNNSGKSTVLNLIGRHLPVDNSTGRWKSKNEILPLERYGGALGTVPQISIGIDKEDVRALVWDKLPDDGRKPRLKPSFDTIIEILSSDGNYIWHKHRLQDGEKFEIIPEFQEITRNPLAQDVPWEMLQSLISNNSGGSRDQWIANVVKTMSRFMNLNLPRTILIPAIRQIGPSGNQFSSDDFSGFGLIDRLSELQSPDHDKRDETKLFDQINTFLQSVTGEPGSKIEIPHSRAHVLVHMNGRVLPLASLGTGIHEVIMIAAFCTISQNQIVCIEEPELHLHPILQRKLITYLAEKTSNQYFIATHSACFIDTPGAAIFHVKLDDNQTVIERADLDKHRFEISMSLGHRASDIIQSNALIWVEGPSDRIYINHWIKALAPHFREGTHYSIMFYGGRLLSHLSADDDEISEFIKLRALNRHVALVMDSDRETARKGVNATKRRLQKEFNEHGGVAWLTKGREIENYVSHSILQKAVAESYGERYDKPAKGGQFDHALYFYQKNMIKKSSRSISGAIVKNVDKVKIAKKVCEKNANLDILDLRDRVLDLIKMIKDANS